MPDPDIPRGAPDRRSPNPEYAARRLDPHHGTAFIRRVLRAYSRRVACGDIEAITEMAAIAAEMDTAIRDAMCRAR